jgi:hypothetical protein
MVHRFCTSYKCRNVRKSHKSLRPHLTDIIPTARIQPKMSDAATEIIDSPPTTPILFSKPLESFSNWSPPPRSIGLEGWELDTSVPSRPNSPAFFSPLIRNAPIPSQSASIGDGASTSNEPAFPDMGFFIPPLRPPPKNPMNNKKSLREVEEVLGPEINMQKTYEFKSQSEYLLFQKLKAMMDEMATADNIASPQTETSISQTEPHPKQSFESLSAFLQSTGDHAFVDAALARLDFRCLAALDPELALTQLKKRRGLITLLFLGGLFDCDNMYYSGPFSLLCVNAVVYVGLVRLPLTKDHDLRARVVFHVGTAVIHAICGRLKHEVLGWRHLRRGNIMALVLWAMILGHLVTAYFQYTMLAEYRDNWRERWARLDERS